MKRHLIILTVFIGFSSIAGAQTFSEWFKQKKTQEKYLTQQIAALQVYIGYAKKGYRIARESLTAISDFRNGEFDLHKGYFSSLKNVNPSVKHYSKVAGIVALQMEIIRGYHKAYRQITQYNAFTGNELSYIRQAFGRLLDDCADVIDDLITLITSGELEMKDDERLKRIDILYGAMQDNYSFLRYFGNQTLLMAVSRLKEENDVNVIRSLNGIKKD